MPLQFVTGRSGYGKTAFCLNQMKQLSESGINTVLLVPEQLSLSSEHEAIGFLSYLDDTKTVLSFNRLFHYLYNKHIGKKRVLISKIGKSMLLSKTIYSCRNDYSVYSASAKNSDLSNLLLATITEFKRYGLSPQMLEDEISALDDNLTKLKMQDLALTYKTFEENLEKMGFNNDDNLTVLERIIPDCNELSKTVFFIDGFEGFTPQEINVIKALCDNSKHVYITLTTDNASPVFAPAQKTKSMLSEIITPLRDINLNADITHANDELKFLEQNYGTYSKKQYQKPTENISLFVSDNQYAEVDMCARDIIEKTKQGYKFNEMAVVFGDTQSYLPLISTSFEKHQITYFADKKHSIVNHPLSILLLSLCDIFIDNFSCESVFSFLKTYLTDISFDDICLLENYVLATGIKGKRWEKTWTFNTGNDDLNRLNETRVKFLNLVMPFRNSTKGKSGCSSYVVAIKDLLTTLLIPQKISEETLALIQNGNSAKAVEYRQIFNMLINCLNEMLVCMDGVTFGIERFKDYLKSGLSQCEVGIIPPSVNNVICGDISRTRLKKIKILYVLGVNDGLIPPAISGTGILTDAERRYLKKQNIELAPDNKQKALELPYTMYRTFTIPSESLVLSYSLSSADGSILRPSNVLNNIKHLFPNLNEKNSIFCSPEEFITLSDATLLTAVQNSDICEYKQVISWFMEDENNRKKINYILSGKTYDLSAKLSQELVSKVWGDKINTTVSRLESFARCPFSYFMKYGLEIYPKKIYSFDAPDAGTFIHKILEDYCCYVTSNNIDWKTITKQECYLKTNELSSAALDEVLTKLPVLSKRYEFAISKLKKAACDAMWAVVHHINCGSFTPYMSELDLSKNDKIPPLVCETPEGRKMTLYGKIDRVDTSGRGVFRIVDYKSSPHDIDLSKVYQGFSLQLFIYSAALKDKLGKPGGMFYLAVTNPIIEYSGNITPAEAEEKIMKEFKMQGYMVGDDLQDSIKQNHSVFSGYSDVISARFSKDAFTSQRFLNSSEYDYLTKQVLRKCGEFSDKILNGDFEVSPLAESNISACDYCDYTSVCGFDSKYNSFRYADRMTREEIFEGLYHQNGGEKNE
ncbi:MAG: PD-(D/E)XK nuclease family protein [Clostridia bacterium]|nr:PD-(D/E)XK nuclease family protein [Clostridia bacterium]